MADELDRTIVGRQTDISVNSVEMEEFDATWDETDPRQTLTDVSLQVSKGELIAVVGRVGSGKSSLLNALLGKIY